MTAGGKLPLSIILTPPLLLKVSACCFPDLPTIAMVVFLFLLADKSRSNCLDTVSKIPCEAKTAVLNRVKHYIIQQYITTPL